MEGMNVFGTILNQRRSAMDRVTRVKVSRKRLQAGVSDQVHVGLDVHKRSIHMAVWLNGRVERHWVMPANPGQVLAHLEPLRPALVRAVYEAGPTGYGLARRLRSAGLPVEVVAPSKTPQRADRSAKSDRLDCVQLAEYSAARLLRPVAVPTEQQEADRQVLRLRDQTIRKVRRVKQQIKSLLLQHGIPEPAGLKHFSAAGVEALGHLALRKELRFCLDELVGELDESQARLRRVNRRIEELAAEARHAPAVAVLKTHPAVGPITAMTFRTELHHAGRFRDGTEVGQYFGLAPRVRQSGATRRDGPISKTGRGHARAILVQAAWRWVAKDDSAKAVYDRLLHNTGVPQKAIVGVARRLALCLWRMMTRGEPYRQAA
jgi:transposase